MQKRTTFILIGVGVGVCVLLLVLTYWLITERYTLLRDIGTTVPPPYETPEEKRPLYKKFLRHKYSRGTAYDRAKLRKNRFQKNYVL